MKRITLALLAAVAFACPVMAACKTDDIKIVQADLHPRPARNYNVGVVGEILNTCSEPTGAQLQFTFRDANGKVMHVEEPWPASTRNIASNATYPFSFNVVVPGGLPSTMEAKVIAVTQWKPQ